MGEPKTVALPLQLGAVPDALKGGGVAIGNFDGLHLGHQAVLAAAAVPGRPTLALTFEPHPRQFFSRQPLFRMTTAEQKAEVVQALGHDGLVVLPFDATLSRMPAEDFVDRVLVDALGTTHVAVGHDFHFGASRGGNAERLAAWGEAKGFSTSVVTAIADESDTTVSSTRIRQALADGDLTTANTLLGYRYRVCAPIIHGEKRGREMNYPTANQALDAANGLKHGIYAVRIKIGGTWRDGVASFGRRPTFDNGAPLLETFVFDFDGDLYGQTLPVAFVAYLRPELKFDGMDALVRQMDQDSANAKAALGAAEPISPLDAALNF